MKIEFARVIHAAANSLQQDVVSALTDEYARAQGHAIVNVLKTLALRADWSLAFLDTQLTRQRQALEAVAAQLGPYTNRFTIPRGKAPNTMTVSELFDALEVGNRQMVAIDQWLRENPSCLPDDRHTAVKADLEAAMKSLNEYEWQHVAPQTLALLSGAQ